MFARERTTRACRACGPGASPRVASTASSAKLRSVAKERKHLARLWAGQSDRAGHCRGGSSLGRTHGRSRRFVRGVPPGRLESVAALRERDFRNHPRSGSGSVVLPELFERVVGVRIAPSRSRSATPIRHEFLVDAQRRLLPALLRGEYVTAFEDVVPSFVSLGIIARQVRRRGSGGLVSEFVSSITVASGMASTPSVTDRFGGCVSSETAPTAIRTIPAWGVASGRSFRPC